MEAATEAATCKAVRKFVKALLCWAFQCVLCVCQVAIRHNPVINLWKLLSELLCKNDSSFSRTLNTCPAAIPAIRPRVHLLTDS